MKSRVLAVRCVLGLGAAFVAAAVGNGCTVVPAASSSGLASGGGGLLDGGSAPSAQDGGGAGNAGGPLGDADSCEPGNVETFQPGAYHPATAAWQGVCIAKGWIDPIQSFYDVCLGPSAKSEKCDAFRRDYAACAACILTPDSAALYGPVIDHGGFVTGNTAGCIERTDPGALACAKSVQALSQCELASCAANCPVSDGRTLSAYGRCADATDDTGCVAYRDSAACASALGDAGAGAGVEDCLKPDFKHFYDAVAPLFCGPPPPAALDAGAPSAPADASTD